ncbi:MAG: nucleotidyltransferase domain-containing protein [Bacteroidales bacterium]
MESDLLLKELKDHLNRHLNNKVVEVILFGSRVKGTAKKESDYDIVIVINTQDDRKVRREINDLCYDLELKYNIFLDTQIISKDELEYGLRGKHPVFRLAVKEGIHL